MSESHPFDAWSLREAAEALLLVTAALETGLLQLLERERTPEDLAAKRALDRRAVAICLGALEEVGVVERGRRGYRLTAFGLTRFADPAAPAYVAADLPLWRANLRGWLFLEEVLRSGRPLAVDDPPELRGRLCRSLDAKPAARVAGLVEGLLARAPAPRPHVLDVGGGAGTYARAFLERGCRVTLLERPETIRHLAEAFGLGRLEGLSLVGGDFHEGLPAGPFGAVLLADVIHELSPAEARALLARVAEAAAPAAVVGIADLFRGRSSGAAFFAVSLLLYTKAGNTYAEGEVVEWLVGAGFADPLVEDLDAGHALVTARRRSGASRRNG